MAYFYESSNLQAKVNGLTHLTWSNNITRLNATNLNKMSKSIRTLAEVLCDGGQSNRGLIQQFDGVRQLVQGNSAVDYSIKDYYAQLAHINRSLYGYRLGDIDHQLGDAASAGENQDQVQNILEYFNITNNHATDNYNNISGVLGKLWWKYYNQDKLFVEEYQRFRNIFRAGNSINNPEEDTSFDVTELGDKKYGIYNAWAAETLNTTFYIDWAKGIQFQFDRGGFFVTPEGNIIPNQDETISIGRQNTRVAEGHFKDVFIDSLLPGRPYAGDVESHTNIGTATPNSDGSGGYFNESYITNMFAAQGNIGKLVPRMNEQGISYVGSQYLPYQNAHFNHADVYNQDIKQSSVVTVGEDLETAESGNYMIGDFEIPEEGAPTLSNVTKAMFGDSADRLYVVNGADVEIEDANGNRTLQDKTTYALINYTTKIDKNVAKIAGGYIEVTPPSFEWGDSSDTGSTNDNNITSYEVGSDITPTYEIKYNKGSYEFGYVQKSGGNYVIEGGKYKAITDDGVGATPTYSVTFNGSTSTSAKGTFSSVHIVDNTRLTLSAECSHSAGQTPLSILGLLVEDRIQEARSNIALTSKTLSGYRRAFASGIKEKSTPLDEYSSTQIRALTTSTYNTKEFEFTTDADTVRVLIAYPTSWGNLISVQDENDSYKNIVESFSEYVVTDVYGYTAGKDATPYRVHKLDFAKPYGSTNKYIVTIG